MHFNSKYNGSSLAPDHFLKAYLINICIARQKNAISQDFFLHQEPFLSSLSKLKRYIQYLCTLIFNCRITITNQKEHCPLKKISTTWCPFHGRKLRLTLNLMNQFSFFQKISLQPWNYLLNSFITQKLGLFHSHYQVYLTFDATQNCCSMCHWRKIGFETCST